MTAGWPEADLLDRTRLRNRMLIGVGRSGDARLYRAVAPFSEVVVADWLVKVYRLPAAGEVELDPVRRDRAALDFAACVAITRTGCESLERIHEVVELDGYRFMCFPDRHGAEPLEHTLARKRILRLVHALYIVEELAHALDVVHEHNIMHRNINPESALVRWDAERWASPVLTDLSYAKFLDGEHAALASEPFGGPNAYRAPEQREDRVHGLPCDVYAIGRLAYEVLAGEPLPASLFTRRPPRLSKFRNDLLPQFADVVQRCLAYEPEARPAAKELWGWARSARLVSLGGPLMTPDETEAWLGSIGQVPATNRS